MNTLNESIFLHFDNLLNADQNHPHIHAVDMPYRLASIWQDNECEIGVWGNTTSPDALAVFQPPWWNLDFVIDPSLRGSKLETEIFKWGIDQMKNYALQSGEEFWGSVEFFEDTPQIDQTIKKLETLGFSKFDWSIVRYELDLSTELPEANLPDGFRIRQLHGRQEVPAYIKLHQETFGSKRMTQAWRERILEQSRYQPELDLIIENEKQEPVGFCICWLRSGIGQIEPLGVLPDYQGIGLGRALELAAYKTLKEHGARTLQVDHASSNEKATSLSLKTGFCRANNALRYFTVIKP